MYSLSSFDPVPEFLQSGYLAIGNFDGVHRGHQALLARLCERARRARKPALAVTFDPRPVDILRPGQAPPPLSWTARKRALLQQAGADHVVVFQTGTWLLGLTANEFFDRVIRAQFRAAGMVEGPTFGFGRDRGGDARVLAEWCRAAAMDFEIVEPVEVDGALVSSTRIRAALAEGRAEDAARLLGRPHRLRGIVTRGAGRGAGLGFPTANLRDVTVLVPKRGVYAAHAFLSDDSSPIPAALHIGPNATFGIEQDSVEAHLLDFSGNLYDAPLELDLLHFLRETRRFDSVAELLQQIRVDLARTRELA